MYSIASFGWDCGRERRVIADDLEGILPSDLVAAGRFRPPLNGNEYKASALLIKPHGDMCTFLRGHEDVFFRGGRHSQTSMAIFPERLADIRLEDRFIRTSILPPSRSSHRHGSVFYKQEEHRFEVAITRCDSLVVIGWSAKGTDDYYEGIFERAREKGMQPPALLIIDKENGDGLARRFHALLRKQVRLRDVWVDGFAEDALHRIEQFLLEGR